MDLNNRFFINKRRAWTGGGHERWPHRRSRGVRAVYLFSVRTFSNQSLADTNSLTHLGQAIFASQNEKLRAYYQIENHLHTHGVFFVFGNFCFRFRFLPIFPFLSFDRFLYVFFFLCFIVLSDFVFGSPVNRYKRIRTYHICTDWSATKRLKCAIRTKLCCLACVEVLPFGDNLVLSIWDSECFFLKGIEGVLHHWIWLLCIDLLQSSAAAPQRGLLGNGMAALLDRLIAYKSPCCCIEFPRNPTCHTSHLCARYFFDFTRLTPFKPLSDQQRIIIVRPQTGCAPSDHGRAPQLLLLPWTLANLCVRGRIGSC